jgi:hypothetical protein
MPLFYLHLCNGQGLVEDEEGADYPTIAAARSAAIKGLRDALAGDIQSGQINIAAFIEIEDAQHAHIMTVHFADAVDISTENGRTPR